MRKATTPAGKAFAVFALRAFPFTCICIPGDKHLQAVHLDLHNIQVHLHIILNAGGACDHLVCTPRTIARAIRPGLERDGSHPTRFHVKRQSNPCYQTVI